MLDRERTEEERIAENKRVFGKENPTFDDMRDLVEKRSKHTSKLFDDAINSRWTWGNNKSNLEMFRELMVLISSNQLDRLDIWEYLSNMDKAIRLLSDEIGKMKGVSKKDFDNLKAKMDKLLESPAVKTLSNILNRNEEAIKKINARREKLIRDSVV
jgi:hypothetical protein